MDSSEDNTFNNSISLNFTSIQQSPRVLNSFLSRRNQLHRKITQLYKSQYNYIEPSSIRFLELEARRGRTLITESFTYTPKGTKSKDPLLLSIQREHKNRHDGTQIITLPKTPFGIHPKYDESDFVNKHFVSPESDDPKLFEFSKKFRIFQKRVRKSPNGTNAKPQSSQKLSSRENVDVYKTKAGELICGRHKKVIKAYEEENEKFKNFNRGLSLDAVRRQKCGDGEVKKKKGEIREEINKTVERLSSTRMDTTKSVFYSNVLSKYPALFADD